MIKNFELQALCGKYLIPLHLALEDEEIMDLLGLPIFTRQDKETVLIDIEKILITNF